MDLERLGGRKLMLSPETGGGQKMYRSKAHQIKTKLYIVFAFLMYENIDFSTPGGTRNDTKRTPNDMKCT